MEVNNASVSVHQVDQIPKPVEQKAGKAFGLSVKEIEGTSLVSQEISNDNLDSYLFKVVDKKGKPEDGFVLVIGKEQLQKLENKSSVVFAGLYNATPVKESEGNVFSRGWALVSGRFF